MQRAGQAATIAEIQKITPGRGPNLMFLGVNIDHVATLRQARGTPYPVPLEAARVALESGADSITVHLREDRRHIQDHDVAQLLDKLDCRLNLEMAVTDEMIEIALAGRPTDCCLVPAGGVNHRGRS